MSLVLSPNQTPNGCCEDSFIGPAETYPQGDCIAAITQKLRPLRRTSRNAVESKQPIRSPVSHLLGMCGPTAVALAIAFIVVNPIEAQAFWAMPHVGEERSERIKPSLANGYPPLTVLAKVFVVGVSASGDHGSPRHELTTHGTASGVPMGSTGRKHVAVEATTRLTAAVIKAVRHNSTSDAALAPTLPHDMIPASRGGVDNGPASERQSTKIPGFRHCITSTMSEPPNENCGATAGVAGFGCDPSPTADFIIAPIQA
jgi:hypothetical protein